MRSNKDIRRKKLSLAFTITLCIFFIPLSVMNVTLIIKSYINPDKVPDFFGIKPFVVLTGSMEPNIYGGDLIISKNVNPEDLQMGDIISFKIGNAVVTHRIVGLTDYNGEPAFITQGDANNAKDVSPVSYSQVEGNYIFKISKLGYFTMFIQKPMGMIIFVIIPLLGVIIYEFSRQRRENENERQNQMQAEIEELKHLISKKLGNKN